MSHRLDLEGEEEKRMPKNWGIKGSVSINGGDTVNLSDNELSIVQSDGQHDIETPAGQFNKKFNL